MTESPLPINPTAHNVPEYSVSEIAGAVKRMVEDRFGRVRVRGEISQWKVHAASGHAYFRLKDQGAVLDAVCWKGSVSKLKFAVEDGLEIIATGRLTTYAAKSNYQLVVEAMEPAGAGALMALLEKRRAALAAEGLFDTARKKPLPYLPSTIGIVTSPSGAVIRDMLHRIAERFPAHVVVWPVAVQGEGAAEHIAAAIHGFNALGPASRIPTPDVLIVARGGGSLEDLWAFNEEVVVRAAAASHIPLISAIGHETDTTLIDFAADRRAPTPTAAAEMAVPVREELRAALSGLSSRQASAWARHVHTQEERLLGLMRGLPRPHALLEHAMQRLDGWSERLLGALPALLRAKSQRLAAAGAALRPQLLVKDIEALERALHLATYQLRQAADRALSQRERNVETLARVLTNLDYRQVLKRGYALVMAGEKPVTTAAAARTHASLTLVFHDGEVPAAPT